MLNARSMSTLCCLSLFAGSASAQLIGAGFDASLYDIVPDVAQTSAAATSFGSAGATPGGAAFDGQYLYVENADNPAEFLQIDPAGVEPTVSLSRAYTTASGGANNNLAADANGVLWEIDTGSANIYSLFIDGSGSVARNLVGTAFDIVNFAAPSTIGDIAWGPDGLLYISSAEGNFTWDPNTDTTTLLGGAEVFTGLAWFDGQLYGSFGDPFLRALVPLDPATMTSGPSYLFEFGVAGFADLASFNGDGPEEPCDPNQPKVVAEDGVLVQTLIAGRHINAGTVTTEVVGSDLVVTYNTTNAWGLLEIHLWAGLDTADMPQTRRGTPKIGRFPYKAEHLCGATSYSVTIPLADLGIACPVDPDREIYIAAHAVVSRCGRCETAWADGDRFTRRRMWGMRYTASFECVCDGPPPVVTTCETAYAFSDGATFGQEPDSTCFLDIDTNGDNILDENDFNAWGWTIKIPHTDVDGFYTLPIYARAEDCDTSVGIEVGILDIVYSVPNDVSTQPVQVFVTYDMNPGFQMDEIHFYQGGEPLPLDMDTNEPTIALDQFPVIVDNFTGSPDANFSTEYIFDFAWDPDTDNDGILDGVYIIANAIVCGEFPDAPPPTE
jgi:hypothetical protein